MILDKYFTVNVISKTPNPQEVCYLAMHQDYSSELVSEGFIPDKEKCGEIIVKRLLSGDRGHYGPMEHVNIVFNCGYFPHSVIQQATRHRVGTSFDVMSFRYISLQILEVASGGRDVETVFYLRPVGNYSDRSGKKYFYSEQQRNNDIDWCREAARRYWADITAYDWLIYHC